MDPVWLVVAFAFGLVARQVGLPPLVGYLGAGFVLRAFGAEAGATIEEVGGLGVQLLLFSIGLKLQVRGLIRPSVWGTATVHMILTVLLFTGGVLGLAKAGVPVFRDVEPTTALLVAFALSFSSTVFAVKILEARGQTWSLFGRTSIGILIVQDLFAIVFLTLSLGKMPSPWALCLLGLPLVRWPARWLMERCDHGELLMLLGVMFVFGSAMLFEVVSMKPDLGVLVMGVLVGGHAKSEELARTLLSFKDIFLVGFFLSIGLADDPTLGTLGVAAVLAVVLPLKVGLFFAIMTRFRLRSRTALLGALSLANYSEFGLIVADVAVKKEWLGQEWMTIMAIAVAVTFVIAAPVNARGDQLYGRFGAWLRRWQRADRLPGDEAVDVAGARAMVVGMGRLGTGAYESVRERYGDAVIGLDRDESVVARHQEAGRRVLVGDATDPDFYARTSGIKGIELVMLALPKVAQTVAAYHRIRGTGYTGPVTATAHFPDEVEALRRAGIVAAFDLFSEAGRGYARHVTEALEARARAERGESADQETDITG